MITIAASLATPVYRNENKTSTPHKLFLYSYSLSPLLLILATFMQRGIIKIVWASWLTPCEDAFCHPATLASDVTRPNVRMKSGYYSDPGLSQGCVPHVLGRPEPSNQALPQTLGNCAEKNQIAWAEGSPCMEGLIYPCKWQQGRPLGTTAGYCSNFYLSFNLPTTAPKDQSFRYGFIKNKVMAV